MNVNTFQPLDFSGMIGKQNQNASYLRDSINNGIKDVGNSIDTWQKDKRQWENLLAQQKYQQERDAIADKRYQEQQRYQHGRDALLDARYNTELMRTLGKEQARQDAMLKSQQMMRDRLLTPVRQNPDIDWENEEQFINGLENGSDIENMPSVASGMDYSGMQGRVKNMTASPSDYANFKNFDNRKYVEDYNNQNGVMEYEADNAVFGDNDPYAKIRQYGDAAVMYFQLAQNASNPDDYNAYVNAFNNIVTQKQMNDKLYGQRVSDEQSAFEDKIMTMQNEGLKYGMANNPQWIANLENLKAQYERKFGVPYDSSKNVGLQAGQEQIAENNNARQIKYNNTLAEAQRRAEKLVGTSMYNYAIQKYMNENGYPKFRIQ